MASLTSISLHSSSPIGFALKHDHSSTWLTVRSVTSTRPGWSSKTVPRGLKIRSAATKQAKSPAEEEWKIKRELLLQKKTGFTIIDQMDLLREQVKMLAGEVALCTSSLKRLSEQAATNPDDSQLREQMQKLKDEISEKKFQIRVIEQRMIGSLEMAPCEMSQVRSVDAKEALRLQKENNFVILDVRPEADFKEAHPPNAINVQIYRLIKEWTAWDITRRAAFAFFGIFAGTEENPEFIPSVESKIDKNAKIIVACAAGGTMKPTQNLPEGQQSRSLIAAYLLVLNGYTNVFHLEGGLYSWFKAGLPVESEEEPEE